MSSSTLRRLLAAFVLLLVPIAWLATRFDPYQIDGDAVAYMDLADLLHAHNWHGAVNGYWHPLYPAFLALGQTLFHPTRHTELGAYYAINFLIFLLEAAAMWAFTSALVSLRSRSITPSGLISSGEPLLSANAMRLLGLGLLVVATQRELSMGKVRPDALLQALMLFAFAALLRTLASESLRETLAFAPLVGIFFGLAYLTKSFAFAVGILSIIILAGFGLLIQRRTLQWAATAFALAIVPFALIAGPYVNALSHKYGHLDFGDSGNLNFAWYDANVEKMHLEPWMTSEFGAADVHLAHPNQQLLASPGIYSYRAVPLGTYPDWFDPSYFNQGIKTHFRVGLVLRRDIRNVVLIVRYILNHPEAPLLLVLLLVAGARLRRTRSRRGPFWVPIELIGLLMWAMYTLVNIEERYVTLAWLVVVLPLFAALREPELTTSEDHAHPRHVAAAIITAFAFFALFSSLRVALEQRRDFSAEGRLPVWRDPQIFAAADGLAALGVQPGDEVACMGVTACLHDFYWARLAGTRITTEIYAPNNNHLVEAWEDLPNRQQAIDTVRAQGSKVLVAQFPFGQRAPETAEQQGWRQLGESSYYALPLNIAPPPAPAPAPQPWTGHAAGNQ